MRNESDIKARLGVMFALAAENAARTDWGALGEACPELFDEQRERVYAWDGQVVRGYLQAHGYGVAIPLGLAQRIAARVCRAYGVAEAPVNYRTWGKAHFCNDDGVFLREDDAYGGSLFHELAHWIEMSGAEQHFEDYHGPRFVRTYVDLLAVECRADARFLIAAAERFKVKVGDVKI